MHPWNNRVAALAGSARSTPAFGVSAALAMSAAQIYGGHLWVRAIDFLQQACRRVELSTPLAEGVRDELAQRRIHGCGRPINRIDERLPRLTALTCGLGLDAGPHLQIANEVEPLLVAHDPRLQMNYAALTAALAADPGFSARELHHFQVPMLLVGMAPCFIEASEREARTVFPLSCEHLAYEAPAKRPWLR